MFFIDIYLLLSITYFHIHPIERQSNPPIPTNWVHRPNPKLMDRGVNKGGLTQKQK